MPLYEYRCDRCGDVFEVIQKFADQPLLVHEACGGKVERLLSASSFQLKGSGWYVTDYARKPKGSNGEPKKSKDDSAGKPDTKPQTPAPPAPASSDKK